MQLPKFLFVDSPEIKGAGLILSTSIPYQIVKLTKFNKPEDFELFRMQSNKPFEPVPGYMIVLQEYAALDKSKPIEDIKPLLQEMALYYLETKIEPNKGYYKRNLL